MWCLPYSCSLSILLQDRTAESCITQMHCIHSLTANSDPAKLPGGWNKEENCSRHYNITMCSFEWNNVSSCVGGYYFITNFNQMPEDFCLLWRTCHWVLQEAFQWKKNTPPTPPPFRLEKAVWLFKQFLMKSHIIASPLGHFKSRANFTEPTCS